MKISVVIPLYNKAPFVEKAVRSVLSQSFTDYELIVVDDGSSDESPEIAMRVMEDHDNCRMIRQENSGVSTTRNNGVAASHGDYLCFLDADDWWEPTFLEEMVRLIDEFPEAGIYGTNYTILNETKQKTRVAAIGVDDGFEKGYINYCLTYSKTMYMPLTSTSVAIPRRVFDEMKGFPEHVKLGEDFLLWIHIALRYKVAFLNKALACYNQDVNRAQRGVGKLYPPKNHMLWNLMDLEPLERSNQDYKQLIDNLRTYGLMPYYLTKKYHEAAKCELDKVDWSRQPAKTIREYKRPVGLLQLKYKLMKIGSIIKQKIISYSNGTEKSLQKNYP